MLLLSSLRASPSGLPPVHWIRRARVKIRVQHFDVMQVIDVLGLVFKRLGCAIAVFARVPVKLFGEGAIFSGLRRGRARRLYGQLLLLGGRVSILRIGLARRGDLRGVVAVLLVHRFERNQVLLPVTLLLIAGRCLLVAIKLILRIRIVPRFQLLDV